MAVHPSANIAPTARIAAGAEIGPEVEVGDFCVIEDDVSIGPRTRLEPHVFVKRWTHAWRGKRDLGEYGPGDRSARQELRR